jgi:hypothetical protein
MQQNKLVYGYRKARKFLAKEGKIAQNSISHFKSSINSSVIDAPASLLHLSSFNAPKVLHLCVKTKVQIGKRSNMDIKFFLWE